jgi:hypothetical protein
MRAKSIFNLKGNNTTHSSIDSGHSQEEVYVEKVKTLDEIRKIKEKLKGDSKPKLAGLFAEAKSAEWSNFYEKFMNEVVSNKNVTSKEIELRINSVLNSIKHNDKQKQNREERKVGNSLLQKNKYEFYNKNKFIPIVLSKYNSFLNDGKEDIAKKTMPVKNTFSTSTIGKSLLKKPTSKNFDFERKRTVMLDNSPTKNFRSSLTLRKNTTLYARQSTKNVYGSNLKTIELKGSQDLNKSLGSAKNIRDTIRSNDNSFSYERGNENTPPMYPNCKIIFF